MKILLSSAIIISCLFANSQIISEPQASLTLAMQQEGGANGIGVAYNPKFGIYYSAIAGNGDFPLECFSREKNIYQSSVGFDSRGLWFNEKSGTIEGNSYEGAGIYVTTLDGKGFPSGQAENKYPGAQPDVQSVGAFDPSTKEILYFDYTKGEVTRYKLTSGKKGAVITLKGCPVDFASLSNTVVYTGQKNLELGFYDFLDAKIYLFNKKGEFQSTVLLPEDAPYNEMFNFAFANGYIFLFDKDMREWIGYKIFE